MRRQTKWVFGLLAVVFALSFAFLGVGSGSSGLSDFLNGNIHIFGGGSSDPVKKLIKQVTKDPGNASLRLQLAQALDGKGRVDESVGQYEQYVKLRPNNVDGLSQLAGEYGKQAQQLTTDAQNVAQSGSTPEISVLNSYSPAGSSSKLATALASLTEPLFSATALQQGQQVVLADKAQTAYAKRAATFRKLAKLEPDNPSWLFQVADTDRQANRAAAAIAEYQQFIKAFPDDTADIAIARQYIKQLKAPPSASSQTTGATPAVTG
jgi:predicted Zn-dependent protease